MSNWRERVVTFLMLSGVALPSANSFIGSYGQAR